MRRATTQAELIQVAAAISVRNAKAVRRPNKQTTTNFEACKEQAGEMLKEQDFSDAMPGHLVALFARMHEQMYGVEAIELRQESERGNARMAAAKMLREHFDNEPHAMAGYMIWIVNREMKRVAADPMKAAKFRITWRFMFSNTKLLGDFLVAQRAVAVKKRRVVK